jgi:hypothetical protein
VASVREQVIRKLREADRRLSEGAEVADVAWHPEVSHGTSALQLPTPSATGAAWSAPGLVTPGGTRGWSPTAATCVTNSWPSRSSPPCRNPGPCRRLAKRVQRLPAPLILGMLIPAEFAAQWRRTNQPQLSQLVDHQMWVRSLGLYQPGVEGRAARSCGSYD